MRCTAARSSMLAPYIPQVSLASSRELLDSRLAAATAFENNFYRFIQLGSDSGQLGSVVGLMASASDNANEIYAEMLQTSRTRYKNAQTANKEAIPKFAVSEKTEPEGRGGVSISFWALVR